MEAWDLYWITRLDEIKNVLEVISLLSTVGLIIIGLLSIFAFIEEIDTFKKSLKSFGSLILMVLILSMGLHAFIPTTKQYLAFISIDYIIHEEKVIDTADKLYEVLDQYLDNKLEEEKE